MNLSSKPSAKLFVDIKSDKQTHHIPKQIQVLGADLSLKQSTWISDNQWQQEVPAGVYVVRVNFSSGSQLEQIVDLTEKPAATTTFDTAGIAPDLDVQLRHFIKSNAAPAIKSAGFRNEDKPLFLQNVSVNRWIRSGSSWTSSPEPSMQHLLLTEEGNTYVLLTQQRLEILQFIIPGEESLFVSLPPAHEIECLVKVIGSPVSGKSVIDVCITTKNYKAQSLLSLITSGDISKARSLVSAKEAEELLYQKLADPASAAIGGYYLLKTGDLERMHDWAKNLSNYFPWFPDGKILYAWQLIQQPANTIPVMQIRDLLLQAVQGGIPVFTEGLRLLYEGINMLAFEVGHADTEVTNTSALVRRYMDTADMGQDTTSFVGNAPDDPGYAGAKSLAPLEVH